MKGPRWSRGLLIAALCAVAPVLAVGQQASYYVLDGFGGVHAGGDAPAITPATPFFGFDIARDLAYVAVGKRIGTIDVVGDGLLVLDGFGGIHTGGALPRSMATPTTPYFGFDVARAITYRNVAPRASGREVAGALELLSPAWTPVVTTTIRAPDDGFLMVSASTNVRCAATPATSTSARVGLALDGINVSSAPHWVRCDDSTYENVALVRTFPVSAGAHFVHMVASRSAGTGQIFFESRAIQILFVDQDDMGGS